MREYLQLYISDQFSSIGIPVQGLGFIITVINLLALVFKER